VRGLLTSLTDVPHRSLVFSIMGTLDIMGTLIGGPLWPAVYHVGLGIGGLYIGLPFIVAAAIFALVFGTVQASKASIGKLVLRRHL
jgi:predicted membrane-bound spermidine synthase